MPESLVYVYDMTVLSTFQPYRVLVVDTLGAGDTFRAGVVYALLKCLDDEACVRFAAASAAVACTRFPSVNQPPGLDEIDALLQEH